MAVIVVQITIIAAEGTLHQTLSILECGFHALPTRMMDEGVEEAIEEAGVGGGFTNTNELHTHTPMSTP
jgi:hypothetical protein